MNTDKDATQKAVEDALRRRQQNLRQTKKEERIDEVAFIVGASTVLQAIFGTEDKMTDYIPPLWIIAPMTGRRILNP